MTDGKQSRLVPRRRFPEFVHLPAWEHTTLHATAPFATGRVPVDQVPLADYISTENLVSDFGGVTTATRQPPSGCATRYQPGDVLVANIRPYLRKVWRADRFGGASNDVIVMRPTKDINPCFFEHVIKNDAFIAYVMRTAKGVKMPRGDLGSIRKYTVFRPTRDEQQKVADCLGSLDDLIAAQDRKLETLRQHKQGLMQQLFPQPGETLPKLRFPEFAENPEWKRTSLAEAFKTITNGKANSQDHQDSSEYPLFDRSEVVKRSPTFLFDAEAIILPGEGMSFQPRYFKGKFNLHQRAYALMDAKVIPFFAFYALDRFKSDIKDRAVHSTVRSLRLPIIEKFTIPCPEIKAEQQKIADCLGSLDDQIAAESERLEVLRQHKQGLLQQLFPSLEGR